jgi:hypothetical protein
MSYFAKVMDGQVVSIRRASPEFIASFIDSSPGEWIQTSYNTKGGIHYDPTTGQPSADQSKALRKNYAGIGYRYDKQRDAFYPPKPFPSWTLNETSCQWEAPVAMPTDGKTYNWNEDSGSWVEVATV